MVALPGQVDYVFDGTAFALLNSFTPSQRSLLVQQRYGFGLRNLAPIVPWVKKREYNRGFSQRLPHLPQNTHIFLSLRDSEVHLGQPANEKADCNTSELDLIHPRSGTHSKKAGLRHCRANRT